MTEQNNRGNGGLYFIVGALVLAVAVMGYFYMDGNDGTMGDIEPAAGIERPVNPTTYGNDTLDDTTMDNEAGNDPLDNTTRQYNNDLD